MSRLVRKKEQAANTSSPSPPPNFYPKSSHARKKPPFECPEFTMQKVPHIVLSTELRSIPLSSPAQVLQLELTCTRRSSCCSSLGLLLSSRLQHVTPCRSLASRDGNTSRKNFWETTSSTRVRSSCERVEIRHHNEKNSEKKKTEFYRLMTEI